MSFLVENSDITLQAYNQKDMPQIVDVYKNSIQTLGPAYYTPEQVKAWSSSVDDIENFQKWIDESEPVVAKKSESSIIGFCGMNSEGHLASLFVSPESGRIGVGSALLQHQIESARKLPIPEITLNASEFSKPLFEKFGFQIIKTELSHYKGVDFLRYLMNLVL